jgi:hypothetical protein
MSKYMFYIEGLEIEEWVEAPTEKDARQKLWANLESHEQDNVVQIECIEVEPAY